MKDEEDMTAAQTAVQPAKLYADAPALPARDWWQAAKRGWGQRCPACGEGRMFYKYLKVCDACDNCGEELHHHQADDAPPYLTIFVVGHVIGALMLAGHEYNFNLSIWTEALLYPIIGLLVALWTLPRIKGALIGYQWALRMHGFETAGADRAKDH
jgi:uncharacterized protein (DUF983 family)